MLHAPKLNPSTSAHRLQHEGMKMPSLLAKNGVLTCMILLVSAESDVCQLCSCYGNRTDCSGRRLTQVPSPWPNDTVWIDLSHNQITFISPQAFLGLTDLIHLDLSWNAISSLNDSSVFIGLSELLYLNLNENPLPYASGLADNVFSPLVKLKELHLFTNDCPTLPPDRHVQGLQTLETLAIVVTKQGRIGEKLAYLRALNTLMLTSRQCYIQGIDEGDARNLARLPLQRLSLRNSKLKELDPTFLRYFNQTLTKLDLSCNFFDNLPSIIEALRGTKLDTLLLDAATSNFMPIEMNAGFFSVLSSTPLRVLSAARNLYLQLDIGKDVASYRMPHLRYLRLGYSQLMLHSKQTEENAVLAAMFLLFNLRVLDIDGLFTFDGHEGAGQDDIFCREPDPLFSNDKQPWESDQLRYPLPDSFWSWLLFAFLRLAFLNELTLPPALTRLYAAELGGHFNVFSCDSRKIFFKNNVEVVDLSQAAIGNLECNYSGLSSVTEVRLGQVGLKSFNPSYFSLDSMPSLITLDLHGNQLGPLIDTPSSRGAFTGMSGVRYLDLSDNGITVMREEVLSGLNNVMLINLSRNGIGSWESSIASLSQLKVLDISSNQLSSLSRKAMIEFDSHAVVVPDFFVRLSANPILCSCDNIDFLRWLTNTKVAHNVTTCLDGSVTKVINAQLLLELRWRCTGMLVLIITLAVLSALLIPAILSYACKWRIRYMYYRWRRLCRHGRSPWLTDKVKVYIASHKSAGTAAVKLFRYLETHVAIARVASRHSIALGQYELARVAELIDECDVMVLVISPVSLSDPKFEFEFYMALEKGMLSVLPIITNAFSASPSHPRPLKKLLTSNSYLQAPPDSDHDDLDAQWQQFLVIFESSLLNIVRRRSTRGRRISGVVDLMNDEERRPLLA